MPQNHLSRLAAQGRLGLKWEARVTTTQRDAILAVCGNVSDLSVDDLFGYVSTGDRGYCTDEVYMRLQNIARAVKAGYPESVSKRVWPRKIAAVLLDRLA